MCRERCARDAGGRVRLVFEGRGGGRVSSRRKRFHTSLRIFSLFSPHTTMARPALSALLLAALCVGE